MMKRLFYITINFSAVMVLRLISAAVVGVALKFPGDIVLNCSAHQQPQKLLVCANTFSILYKLLAQHQQRHTPIRMHYLFILNILQIPEPLSP